jgi:hypothetical protein
MQDLPCGFWDSVWLRRVATQCARAALAADYSQVGITNLRMYVVNYQTGPYTPELTSRQVVRFGLDIDNGDRHTFRVTIGQNTFKMRVNNRFIKSDAGKLLYWTRSDESDSLEVVDDH